MNLQKDGSELSDDVLFNGNSKEAFENIKVESLNSAENENLIDPSIEKRVLFKLDVFVVSWLSLFYFFCQLDRSNIGNANTAGLSEDIHLKGNQFGDATTYLYITYVVFEPVNTLIFKKLSPKYVIIGCVFAWGITTTCQSFIQNAGGFFACRLIMGLFESGILPIIYTLSSTVFTKSEKTKRHSVVYMFAAFSSAFGGVLAYGLLRIHGPKHLREGWRILFFIEGLITLFSIPFALVLFPKDLKTAWFFDEEERNCYAKRLRVYPELSETDKFEWKVIWNMFRDSAFYLQSISQFCYALSFFAGTTFLPTIVSGMGFGGIRSNLMVVPVYLYGAIYYCFVGVLSDRFKNRSIYMIISLIAMIIGLAILLAAKQNGVRFLGCFFMIMGVYPLTGLGMMWLGDNLLTHYEKAAYVGFVMALSNISGIVYGQIFRDKDSPDYIYGLRITLGLGCVGVLTLILNVLLFKYRNDQRDKLFQQAEINGTVILDQPELGDRNPHYRYTY